MSPQELLRQTQKAAGDENLTIWHDTLISSGKNVKILREVRRFMSPLPTLTINTFSIWSPIEIN
jgi:hypothetical protein